MAIVIVYSFEVNYYYGFVCSWQTFNFYSFTKEVKFSFYSDVFDELNRMRDEMQLKVMQDKHTDTSSSVS